MGMAIDQRVETIKDFYIQVHMQPEMRGCVHMNNKTGMFMAALFITSSN